jgi:polyferredoxin
MKRKESIMQILKNIVFPLIVCVVLAITGFVISDWYAPSPGPYINAFAALCYSLMGIIGTAALISNMQKR